MLTQEHLEKYESIDAVLGPAAGRFFGLGYRLTDPRLRAVTVEAEGSEWRLAAKADAAAGVTWSVKGEQQQRPHLSTTDLIVLSIAAAYELLARLVPLDDLASWWIETVSVTAPSRPVEGDLAALPVAGSVFVSALLPGSAVPVDLVIAGFAVQLVLRGPATVPDRCAASNQAGRDVKDHPGDGVYCGVYRSRSPRISDVSLGDTAQATVSIPSAEQRPSSELCGFEAAYQPALNLVDAFVATLQLGQALLYRLDGIARSDSDTLWMRKTVMTTPHAPTAQTGSELAVRLERSRVVPMDQDEWRLADIVGTFSSGVTVSCSVAHRLVAA